MGRLGAARAASDATSAPTTSAAPAKKTLRFISLSSIARAVIPGQGLSQFPKRKRSRTHMVPTRSAAFAPKSFGCSLVFAIFWKWRK